MDTKPILTIPEAAEYLRLHPDTLRKMAKEGRIPYFRLGRKILFRRESIDAWITKREVPAPAKR